jgi:hypothetical protein
MISFASVVASIETGHWFAAPFAMMFTFGYGYVATLVVSEQAARRRAARLLPASAAAELESVPPSAPDAQDAQNVSGELAA